MPRSEASRERQRLYAAQWRKANPDYHKKWRKEHHETELERKRKWRAHNADLIRAQRQRYAERHPRQSQAIPGIPAKFIGHPLFETARFICGPEPRLRPEAWEDVMGETILALLEGKDPSEAARKAWAYEYAWTYATGPIYSNVDIVEGSREVVVTLRRRD